MSTVPDSSTTFHKEIRYDRTTRDYALYLGGELVGFTCSYHQGERTLDALVYERLTHGGDLYGIVEFVFEGTGESAERETSARKEGNQQQAA